MKRILGSILLIISLNGWLTGKAQNGKDTMVNNVLRSFLKFEVSFESGFAWEQRIGKTSVIEALAGVGIGGQTDNFFDFKARTIILPLTKVEYRNYYNFKRRVNNYRNTKNNSADFFYGKIQTLYAVRNQNYFGLLFIQGWGLQRSISKHLGGSFRAGVTEHFYYDKPPDGGFNYLKIEPDVMVSIFYAF